jgi:hypothetical protein
MKPQRPQRKTLCPQKDPPNKEIRERQGAYKKSVRDEVIKDRKTVRKGPGRSPSRHLFIRAQ